MSNIAPLPQELGVFDLETSGVDPEQARIVTAYLGLLDSQGNVLREQEWLVRPDGFTIPQAAIDVHGITNEHAQANGRPLADVLGEIVSILGGAISAIVPLSGHNITYDLTVLDRELQRVWPSGPDIAGLLATGVAVLDSLVLDKHIHPFRKGTGSRKLVPLSEAYGVELTEEEAHGARADAIAAGRIVLKQLNAAKITYLASTELTRLQPKWYADAQASLEDWFRNKAPAGRRDPNAAMNRHWPLIPRPAAA